MPSANGDLAFCCFRLKQAKMVRIFGLQGSDQKFELRKAVQTRKARIFQEERPAGEAGADAPFKPFKGSFAPPRQRERASDLIVGMVCVSKGFWTRAGSGYRIDCCVSVPHQSMELTL